MNHHVEQLLTEVSHRHSSTTNLTGGDLLEQLWYCYLEENRADSEGIREGF